MYCLTHKKENPTGGLLTKSGGELVLIIVIPENFLSIAARMYAGPAPPEWQLTRSPLRLGQAAGQIAEIAATDVICRPLVELARYCHEIDSAPYPRPTTNLGFPYFLWMAPASYQQSCNHPVHKPGPTIHAARTSLRQSGTASYPDWLRTPRHHQLDCPW